MLSKLYIRNFALIEELEITLGSGLNILTGETGAGKSLLLGAIGLILGRRVDYSMIFDQGKKCIVEAVFANLPAGILKELEGNDDFDLSDGELDERGNPSVRIRREASSSGKSRAFINDTPVQLTVLKEVTGLLVDLHGQHENQKLLSPEQQLHLLDQYAGVVDDARQFKSLLSKAKKLSKEIEHLEEEERAAREQQDYLLFQLEELEKADLVAGEDETLEQQLGILQNAEEIQQVLSQSTDSLYDNEQSLYNQLSEIIEALGRVSQFDPKIQEQYERLNEALIAMEDSSRELDRLKDNVESDPLALEAVEERMDLLNRLKQKFSAQNVEELIETRRGFAEKTERFDSLGEEISRLRKQEAKALEEVANLGLVIEQKRIAAAKPLKAEVDRLMQEVGLEHARFEVAVSRNLHPEGKIKLGKDLVRPLATGINLADFKIQTNKGMPMGSLNAVASGGEVSRVMLAIKAALASKAELSVLIFDEIDTGISGEVANKVGRVMQGLANNYQLIAITHLPQIAGKGDHHYKIYKEVAGDKTVTSIRPLETDGRVMELAIMLSGEHPSESAIRNAKELITSRN